MNAVLKEKEYRSIKDRLSYSSLKEFSKDRHKFYRKYIIGEPVKEELSDSLTLGNLVDCLILTEDEFDEKFHLNSIKRPAGQMGDLCEEMYSVSYPNINSFGELNSITRKEVFSIAFSTLQRGGKFKGKKEDKIYESFTDDVNDDGFTAEDYYDELISSYGKIPVDLEQVERAKYIKEFVLSSETEASRILTMADSSGIQAVNQLTILFEIGNMPFKCMLDRVVIDHSQKLIQPYDMKVTWELEDFQYNFLKMGYYIQLGVYNLGLKTYVEQIRPDLKDYKIEPLAFITVDPSSRSNPIVYKTNGQWVEDATNGKNRYKGVLQLLDEINTHLSSGNWKDSIEAANNGGIIQLQNLE